MKKKNVPSNADIEQWENYVKDPKDIFDKELVKKNIFNENNRYRFDLHGFTLSDANKKVTELITYCQQNSYDEILLITGKGLHSNTDQNEYVSKELSKLKFAVPEYIKSQKELFNKVTGIEQANIRDGGEGAIIIKLKNL